MARFVTFYRSLSVFIVNTLIVIVVLNVAAAFYLRSLPPGDRIGAARRDNPIFRTYGEKVYAAYPGWKRSDVDALLAETWNRPLAFQAYTHFREAAFSGRYLNIDPNGFRHVENQGPWPPDPGNFNIFMFGGSTTFGYGLPDDLTIASRLQSLLDEVDPRSVRLYNFGCAYYFSTQERILFQNLLIDGFVPNLAIFLDGLNDLYKGFADNEPLHAATMRKLWSRRQREEKPDQMISLGPMEAVEELLPMVPAVRNIRSRISGSPSSAESALRDLEGGSGSKPKSRRPDKNAETRLITQLYDEKGIDQIAVERAVDRYVGTIRAIEASALAWGPTVLFVWQPIPTYKYDLGTHLFLGPSLMLHRTARFGSIQIEARRAQLGDNFLWLGDLFEQARDPMYVDSLHYSAEGSERIAQALAEHLERARSGVEPKSATSITR